MPVCPLHSDFVFCSTCKVTSCMHQSSRVDSGCLILGRKEADGGTITDDEIAFYKGLTTQAYVKAKKKAVEQAQQIMVLHKFAEFVHPHTLRETETIAGNLIYRELIRLWPLNVPLLDMSPIKLQLLLSPRQWKAFYATNGRTFGTFEARHHCVLGITKGQLLNYWRQIHECRRQKAEQEECV